MIFFIQPFLIKVIFNLGRRYLELIPADFSLGTLLTCRQKTKTLAVKYPALQSNMDKEISRIQWGGASLPWLQPLMEKIGRSQRETVWTDKDVKGAPPSYRKSLFRSFAHCAQSSECTLRLIMSFLWLSLQVESASSWITTGQAILWHEWSPK